MFFFVRHGKAGGAVLASYRNAMTGRELKKARIQRGLGMRELARLAKVSVGTISAAESGKFKPRGATIRKLVSAMSKIEKLPKL